jgi:outer membrane protein assembly factor BamB
MNAFYYPTAKTFCFAAVVVATLCCCASAEDWLQWRGPDRANRSAETGLFGTWSSEGPPLQWTGQGIGSGYASVSVQGDRIYTTGNGSDSQFVSAINATDGSLVWTTPISNTKPNHHYEGSRSTPTIDGENLYVVSSDGKIVCLKSDDGSVVWMRDFDEFDGKMMSIWGYSESPLVDGDIVLCTPGGRKAVVVALNKRTGDDIWKCRLPKFKSNDAGANGRPLKDGAGYSSIVVGQCEGKKIYLQLVGRGLIGIDSATGSCLWRYKKVANPTANIPTPIVSGDYVFTSTAYNTGSALLKMVKKKGRLAYTEVYQLPPKQLQNKHGGLTLVDGHLYCGHGNGSGLPICLEMATGKIKWGPERSKGKGESSCVYADGHVIFRREDGTVNLIKADPAAYQLIASFKPDFQEGKSWAHPVIANGRLYLREQDKLMCYRLK